MSMFAKVFRQQMPQKYGSQMTVVATCAITTPAYQKEPFATSYGSSKPEAVK